MKKQFVGLLLVSLIAGCSDIETERKVVRATAVPLVLAGVTVIDPGTGRRSNNQTVLTRLGKIEAVMGPSDVLPADAELIDARGKYLIPGYIDMHVHVLGEPDIGQSVALMLAHGITGFRQMRGSPDILAALRSGTLPIGDDEPEALSVPGELLTPINTRKEALTKRIVKEQKDAGADFIKVGLVNAHSLQIILETAQKLGLKVAGHLPAAVDSLSAAKNGMASIEHLGTAMNMLVSCTNDEEALRAKAPKPPKFLDSWVVAMPFAGKILDFVLPKILLNPVMISPAEEFLRMQSIVDSYDEDRCQNFASQHAQTDTWQVPTLDRLRRQYYADSPEYSSDLANRFMALPKKSALADMRSEFSSVMNGQQRKAMVGIYALSLVLVKTLDDAGVKLLAGSDSGAGDVGFGLHREFDELARAGISPLRILQMATVNAAEYAGRGDALGSVTVGKTADLVLLNEDPTVDSRNLHEIHAVMRNGFYYKRSDLDELLRKAEAWHGTEVAL